MQEKELTFVIPTHRLREVAGQVITGRKGLPCVRVQNMPK